ncbi:hypothetical protein H0H87_010264 [Tephrocybe sp. NHM501043]|nr:hypothetical protein H0H87_010264 [Tephrocybe sp. NHM501043]
MPNTALGAGFKADLLKRSISLDTVYQQAKFELRVGRISEQRESTASSVKSVIRTFYAPAIDLGNAILDSMAAIEATIVVCFNQSNPFQGTESQEGALIDGAKDCLKSALLSAQAELKKACDNEDFGLQLSGDSLDVSTEVFHLCSFMVSLLQVCHYLHFPFE